MKVIPYDRWDAVGSILPPLPLMLEPVVIVTPDPTQEAPVSCRSGLTISAPLGLAMGGRNIGVAVSMCGAVGVPVLSMDLGICSVGFRL